MDSYGVPVSAPLQYDNGDSYGVPVSDPLVAPVSYDYPEYVQYYEPDLVVPDYSAVTEAPVYAPATNPPEYGYEYDYPAEEPEPEINQ